MHSANLLSACDYYDHILPFFIFDTVRTREFAAVQSIILLVATLIMVGCFFSFRPYVQPIISFLVFMDMILLIGPLLFVIEIVTGFHPDDIPDSKFAMGLVPYMLLISLVFMRMVTWAVTFAPADGELVVSDNVLCQRLLAIGNDEKSPFIMSPGKRHDELIMDWKYADATWFDLMRVHKMSYLKRFVLRLDTENHIVRVREYESKLDASAGLGSGNLSFKASLGIDFYNYQKEIVFGIQIENGRPVPKLSYTYTFNVLEMRQPLQGMVVQNGWTYKGVLLFMPWLTG